MPVQNHIHLSTQVQTTGEKAPTYRWKIIKHQYTPQVVLSLNLSLAGTRMPMYVGAYNTPKQFPLYEIVVLIGGSGTTEATRENDLYLLRDMAGKVVKYVDILHCADNNDHTAYIQTLVVTSVGPVESPANTWPLYYVPIKLEGL